MSTTYEPGTVAVATVRGVPNVRVFRLPKVHDFHVYRWQSAVPIGESVSWKDEDVTDVRPLVALDLDDPSEHAAVLREFAPADSLACLSWLADQIEAQTKPSRIPEPGLWGVVEAKYGDTPVRTFVRERDGWSSLTNPGRAGVMCDWDRLVDPVLIRDGIEDGAS